MFPDQSCTPAFCLVLTRARCATHCLVVASNVLFCSASHAVAFSVQGFCVGTGLVMFAALGPRTELSSHVEGRPRGPLAESDSRT